MLSPEEIQFIRARAQGKLTGARMQGTDITETLALCYAVEAQAKTIAGGTQDLEEMRSKVVTLQDNLDKALKALDADLTQIQTLTSESSKWREQCAKLVDGCAELHTERDEAAQALLLLWDGIHIDKDAWSMKFSRSDWNRVEAALLAARGEAPASPDSPATDPMPQSELEAFGCQRIHWNENWHGGWFSFRYPVELDKDGNPWAYLEVRFDKDPRYGRDYMVYIATDHYALALKQIVTLAQFKTLARLLAK